MSKTSDDKTRVPPVPETVAIALDYDPLTAEDAPRVIAKGKGYMAERILEIAFEKGIRVREDADLAQILAAVDVDTEIPFEAYLAVAEILAYVYNSNNQLPPTAQAGT
ncbi:MAG: EscU/YscU/HrcU family type III secretion system export apparatus switch protein [Alphaproteobacteria bacterium]|nr:EscU/YscU/HrcU family type III secretion system export apparatus switch protein [Alphaproteobacteria bacterium]